MQNRTDTATIEAAEDEPIQHIKDIVADPAMTQHTGHTPTNKVTTLRTTVDHIHALPTNHQSIIHTKEDYIV